MSGTIRGSIMADIDLFFEDPKIPHPPNSGREWGTLHLLRRDIMICFGEYPESGQKINVFALWPGAMAILAGVDLVGKFWKGDDNTLSGKVGERFKCFLERYFHISEGDSNIIYHLRNSLLHSFGLYSKDTRRGKTYRFILSQTSGQLIRYQDKDIYKIDVNILRDKFDGAITEYQKELINDSTLKNNFNKMFPDYGWIDIG
jgi:hypothetical protein